MSSKETIQKLLSLADIKINGNRDWDMRIHNPKVYSRILSGGSLAVGESYMDGWWDVKKLDEFFFRIFRYRINEKFKGIKAFLTWLKAKILNVQTGGKNFRSWKKTL